MMEFIDLQAQRARLKDIIDTRIASVLTHGRFIMGPEVRELEEKLGAFTGAAHCLGCASGTNALELVLAAWGVGPGDAVFTTPLSFIATGEAIARTGAVPVFADISPVGYNLDPSRLGAAIAAVKNSDPSLHPLPRAAAESSLTPRAVVAVDLFGNPADYDAILGIAGKHGLPVLEDGAQALGGSYKGRKLCNCGCRAATTSFFPAKPLGCYGDGGAVFTNDAALSALVDSLRYHGRVDAQNKNDNVRLGCNGRLDTLQAAILLAKLEIFEDEIRLRQEAAARYADLLARYGDAFILPQVAEGDSCNWAQFTIQLPSGTDRGAVMRAMAERGIPTAVNYPKGMHTQECFRYLGHRPDDFPVTQSVCARVLSLPMHPYLGETDQLAVAEALAAACGV